MPAPVKAMIDLFLRASLKPRRRLHILHRDLLTSLPLQALQTLRLPRDRFWPGAMPCRMLSLTPKRGSLSVSRMEGSAIPCYLLSTDSREYPIRLLKEKS